MKKALVLLPLLLVVLFSFFSLRNLIKDKQCLCETRMLQGKSFSVTDTWTNDDVIFYANNIGLYESFNSVDIGYVGN